MKAKEAKVVSGKMIVSIFWDAKGGVFTDYTYRNAKLYEWGVLRQHVKADLCEKQSSQNGLEHRRA